MRVEQSTPLAVVAGLLFDGQGRVLLAARPPGKAFAGRWEFPGGKIDAGEQPIQALVRELQEELAITVRPQDCAPFLRVNHRYPDAVRGVIIDCYRVIAHDGQPIAQEGQSLAWHRPEELPFVDILEADRPIVTALRLGMIIDFDAPIAECVVYDQLAQIKPPATLTGLTGFALQAVNDATVARASGADFFVLQQLPNAHDQRTLIDCGLPWYVPYGQSAAEASGCWRGAYSSVASSMST